MKKFISLILSLTMFATSVLCVNLSALAADEISNRAQWLSQLVQTFEMTVESDNYPDNYFSDLTEDSEYYYDVLLAVEFGVVDIEAGEAVEPEGEISREFAAQTLNYCLKYELEDADDESFEYSFADWEDCLYPTDDQVAVNRGWLELDEDGCFHPEQTVTSAEIEIMLADAQQTLADDEVEEDYDSTYEYEKEVIEVANGTVVEFLDDENTVIIYDTSYDIAEGDTFVVYSNDIPLVYDAKSVTVSDDCITVVTTETANEESVEYVDMQAVFDVDSSEFIPGDGYEVVDDTSSASAYSLRSSSRASNSVSPTIKLTKTIKLLAGNSIKIDVAISNLKASVKLDTEANTITAKVDFDLAIGISGEFDSSEAFDSDDFDELGTIPIAGIGYIKLQPKLSLNGKTSLTQSYNVTLGFSKNETGLHNLSSFSKKEFTYVFEGSAKLGIRAEVGIKVLVAKVGIYAEIGVTARFAAEATTDANDVSTYCITLSAYLYFTVGVQVSVDFVVWKDTLKSEWKIYKESNSPLRLYFHFENGKEVDACTVDSKTKTKYLTPSDSPYGSVYTDNLGDTSNIVSSGDFTLSTNSNGTASITDYTGSATSLSIPEYINGYKITGIGSYAFEYCTSLTNITIPDSVTRIGGDAFTSCTNLTTITIPDSVTSIGGDAFYKCTSLTSVTIPDSVTSISARAFANCTSLTSVTIPNSVTRIGSGAFYYCTNLTSIAIPDSVTSIGDYAFRYCTSLTNVTIPDSVTSIGEVAFGSCKSLTSITIPDSVTYIGNYAFEYCASLTNITIPDSVTYIEDGTFYGCTSLISVTIPDSVTVIRIAAFAHCTSLTNIIIPDSVTFICEHTFYDCTSLTNATIPDSVTSIGYRAFADCTSLTNITIPKSVTSISDDVFSDCYSLTDVYYTGSEDDWNNITIGDSNDYLLNATIHYNYSPDVDTDTGDNTDTPSGGSTSGDETTTTPSGDNTGTSSGDTSNAGTSTDNTPGTGTTGNNSGANTGTDTGSSAGASTDISTSDTASSTDSSTTTETASSAPKKTSVKKATSPKKKQIKVTWKKKSNVTGYQIQYATNKKFTKNKKTVTVKGASKTSKTIKKLKSKKTYYVRVRTYKTVNGKKYYSSWSTVKKVTTK